MFCPAPLQVFKCLSAPPLPQAYPEFCWRGKFIEVCRRSLYFKKWFKYFLGAYIELCIHHLFENELDKHLKELCIHIFILHMCIFIMREHVPPPFPPHSPLLNPMLRPKISPKFCYFSVFIEFHPLAV